jgi:hypothetical protein
MSPKGSCDHGYAPALRSSSSERIDINEFRSLGALPIAASSAASFMPDKLYLSSDACASKPGKIFAWRKHRTSSYVPEIFDCSLQIQTVCVCLSRLYKTRMSLSGLFFIHPILSHAQKLASWVYMTVLLGKREGWKLFCVFRLLRDLRHP